MKNKTLFDFPQGGHFSFIYQNSMQLFSVIIPFFSEGIMKNEKCIYISDEFSKKIIVEEFRNQGISLKEHIISGQFDIKCSKDVYLKKGYFDPDDTINLLKAAESKALEEGYSGVRIAGEAMWANTGLPGTEKLMEYESRLEGFFPFSKTTAICLYNEKKMGQGMLAESVHRHPDVIFYGKQHENFYYSPNLHSYGSAGDFPEGTYEFIKKDFSQED